jgi:hypothetical protein
MNDFPCDCNECCGFECPIVQQEYNEYLDYMESEEDE